MRSNNSILHTDGDVAYQNQNITLDNVERGEPSLSNIKMNIILKVTHNYPFNRLTYLQEQLDSKSNNQIKYSVTYNDGIISIKHSADSTSKTSFYIRENYKYDSIRLKNEVVYERVYRKVKTYFDFSKLTSVGPILGFKSNDTQFCDSETSVSSVISFKGDYRRMNMLRYISTAYGMEYKRFIDTNGNEVNRPSSNYKNSSSDSNSNCVEASNKSIC